MYKYFNDLPQSLEILKLTLSHVHVEEIILPKNTVSCVLKGGFSFGVLRLNEKLDYLYIDNIEGKNSAHVELISRDALDENGKHYFIQYTGDSMNIVVPSNLLNKLQISEELNRLSKEKIKPIYAESWSDIVVDNIPKELLVNTYQIVVI